MAPENRTHCGYTSPGYTESSGSRAKTAKHANEVAMKTIQHYMLPISKPPIFRPVRPLRPLRETFCPSHLQKPNFEA